MEYTTTRLDRRTGDLVTVSLGDWVTISEIGQRYGVGPRTVRAILHHMGMLGLEGSRDGKGRRYRLLKAWEAKGYGRRHDFLRNGGRPFDVISPLGQRLIDEAWEITVADYEADLCEVPVVKEAREALAKFKERRLHPRTAKVEVAWLRDHFPALTYQQTAEIVHVSPKQVGQWVKLREERRSFLRRQKAKPLSRLSGEERAAA